jgi:hypothetical protein
MSCLQPNLNHNKIPSITPDMTQTIYESLV